VHVVRVVAVIVLDFPDLGMPHYFDYWELSNQVINEELNSLNS